jgi:Fe(3+) dicitrate transport protein
MMRLKEYSLVFSLLWCFNLASGQSILYVSVVDALNLSPIKGVELHNINTGRTYETNSKGDCWIEDLASDTYDLLAFAEGYQTAQSVVTLHKDIRQKKITIALEPLQIDLSAIIVDAKEESDFALGQLNAVEGTAIFAGKKTEVILLDQLTANLATNNARQMYSQVAGLNIYESADAGLQLSIGGRGLDPNRTASFNTRQNGYDISADVLGYPESYYSPPAEALSQVQVVRGAASLQYGTQFGGLLNFIFKKPPKDKKIEWTSRQTLGSFGLLTSFNSLSGTAGKLSYYSYFNHKRGDGFRPNAGFESNNFFAHVGYAFSDQSSLELEVTYLKYLAQQAGGLTDAQFYKDPLFSNRSRNWFEVDWKLYSAKFKHRFSAKTNMSINVFGLDASRKAVGFRTNRVSQQDDPTAARDLLVGNFRNWGVEQRLVHRYQLGRISSIALIGGKFYQSNNTAIQGPGTASPDADFSLATTDFPYYPSQSDFRFPNLNVALFGEHIFYLTDALSFTPGFRFEHIRTQSEGTYRKIDFDLAGNPIRDQLFDDNRTFRRSFILLGAGLNYKPDQRLNLYANFSQNYRSVTFTDIRTVNPSFQVDPNISDEDGFTADLGVRGQWGRVSYSLSLYGLLYDNRLGEVLKAETRETAEGEMVETGRVIRFRGNIGQAFIHGVESLVDWNALNRNDKLKLNIFINTAITQSRYLNSEIAGVEGNQVEFIPFLNLKSGMRFKYDKWEASAQYTYMSKQYTDASNAEQDVRDNQNGITGAIPAYDVVDFSFAYQFFKRFKLEGGINNVLDRSYFTRRATGYPGPGIIPSSPRAFYLGVEMKW